MKQDGAVHYLHGDHLGSTTLATTSGGAQQGQQRYGAYGLVRTGSGAMPTDYRFTGQRREGGALGINVYDYGARFYSAFIGRFLSADSIVPGAGNPQALNRYAYTLNNPLKYTDPSGHCPWCGDFVEGFFYQMGYNANPIPSGYVGSADALVVSQSESDAMLYGRLAGSVGSGILSYAEVAAGISIGTGGGIGGALACAPTAGGGCAVGAGAVLVGAGLATEGVLTGARAIDASAKTAAILMARGQGGNRPPLPLGRFKTQNDLGEYMGWGTGKDPAVKAANELTLEKIRGSGLSLEDAKQWLQRSIPSPT